MKKLSFLLLGSLFAWLLVHLATWDRRPPEISWHEAPSNVGRATRIVLEVEDEGRGLRTLEVDVVQGEERRTFLSESFSGSWAPWRTPVPSRRIALSADATFSDFPLKEGPFQLEVRAADHAKLFLFSNRTVESQDFNLDLTPPRIDVLSREHYIRQGGSETLLYRVSEPGRSGVIVGDTEFRGYPVPGREDGVHLCIFALDHGQPPEVPMFVWAEDEAGNRSQVSFRRRTFPTRFRERRLQLSEAFMEKVVTEILSNTDEVQRKGSLLESYLAVNGKLRELNNEAIARIARESSEERLWQGPFIQLSRSQVEASFADHRTYVFEGREVDRQTHLGFDLASVARSPVEASNDGIVRFGGYLGIYGNSVILDHGWGLASLYSHLSSIEVSEGAKVRRGQSLGRTGETGLAGGDHLHFSMIVQGVQVNPVEWWDPQWVRQRIDDRLSEGSAGASH